MASMISPIGASPVSQTTRGPRPARWALGIVCVSMVLGAGAAAADMESSPRPATMPEAGVALPITVPRRVPRVVALTHSQVRPDPLRGTPAVKPEATGVDASKVIDRLLPTRSDSPYDWYAPVEPLHQPCEPRALPPCVPPPPCHPSEPPQPYDLVGVSGCPSGGPIYRGPCEPRTGMPHDGPFAWYHRLHDRFVDHFYMWK